MPENPNRGPWIIAAAILLAAGLIVGYLVYQDRQDSKCSEWQAAITANARDYQLTTDQVLSLLDEGEDHRPEGCPDP